MQYPYKQTKKSKGKNGKPRRMDEHRWIMEQHLGRKLDGRREQVHHIDGDKMNNDLSNLQVVTPKEHAALHGMWKHPKTKECSVCGVVFEPHPTKRARAKTCSRECALMHLSIKNRQPDAPYSAYNDNAPPSRAASRKSRRK
jgi:hypothetical protein